MSTTFPQRSLLAAALACAMSATFALRLAHAETPLGVRSLAEAKADYQHDQAACRNHTVDEDTKTCMLEAQRAYGEAKREVARHHGAHMHHAKKKADAQANVNTSGTTPAPNK
jgi:hypothetical protein